MSSPSWTIDELAALAGVPSRTIRDYRTLGLLPAPAKAGRVGIYGDQHRDRLLLIARLQSRGYSLAGIRDLFEAWDKGRSLDQVLGVATFDETPLALSQDQLVTRLPELSTFEARALAQECGLINSGSDGYWYVRSEALLSLVEDLLQAEVPIERCLRVVGGLHRALTGQGAALADFFLAEIWERQDRGAATEFARRARPLIAQAAASLMAEALGDSLGRLASQSDDDELASLISQLRVGVVRTATPQKPEESLECQ